MNSAKILYFLDLLFPGANISNALSTQEPSKGSIFPDLYIPRYPIIPGSYTPGAPYSDTIMLSGIYVHSSQDSIFPRTYSFRASMIPRLYVPRALHLQGKKFPKAYDFHDLMFFGLYVPRATNIQISIFPRLPTPRILYSQCSIFPRPVYSHLYFSKGKTLREH